MKLRTLAAACLFSLSPLALATTVNVQVSTEQHIQNDLMKVSFYALNEGKDPKAISDLNTRIINQAIELAKQTPGVDIAISGRMMSPQYGDKKVVQDGIESHHSALVGFQEKVDLTLSSQDMPALSALMTQLTDELNLGGVDFSVTTATRLEQEQKTTRQTIEAFHEKARQITQAMGLQQYSVKNMHVSPLSSAPQYRPMLMKAEVMRADAAPMAAEGGNSVMQQTVSGEIVLQDKPYMVE